MPFSTIYCLFLPTKHFCGTVFIVSSFSHKLPLFHLAICFAVCLRFCQMCCGWLYRRLAVKSWIRAWTGLWAKQLIQVVWPQIDSDSGDMIQETCLNLLVLVTSTKLTHKTQVNYVSQCHIMPVGINKQGNMWKAHIYFIKGLCLQRLSKGTFVHWHHKTIIN